MYIFSSFSLALLIDLLHITTYICLLTMYRAQILLKLLLIRVKANTIIDG